MMVSSNRAGEEAHLASLTLSVGLLAEGAGFGAGQGATTAPPFVPEAQDARAALALPQGRFVVGGPSGMALSIMPSAFVGFASTG